MKLVGIDYGTKRVGVAVSDASGTMAFPKTILPNDRHLIEVLVECIKNEQAEAVVVGESKNTDGTDNPVMSDIRMFVEELQNKSDVQVHLEPEFYTSVEAKRLALDTETKNPKEPVDAQAAAIILNSYITRMS